MDKGDSELFLLMRGVTQEVFVMLLKVLYTPTDIQQCAASVFGRVGHPPCLVPHAELGMFLFFIGSTMNVKHLVCYLVLHQMFALRQFGDC